MPIDSSNNNLIELNMKPIEMNQINSNDLININENEKSIQMESTKIHDDNDENEIEEKG